MNGAIIGFGNIAQAHIHAYEAVSDMSITGIIDSSETRINYAKQIHPQIKSYTSIEKLFEEQSIDFIDICLSLIHISSICSLAKMLATAMGCVI